MNIETIKNLSEQYDRQHKSLQEDLRQRFKDLVAKYGVSAVAAASGLAESSVSVYSRRNGATVSEYTVVKVETILNNL